MSNSQLFFLSKNREEEIKSAVAAQPSTKDPKGCPNITQSSHLFNFQDFQALPREEENEDACSNHDQSTTSKPLADDDDGFKTPTSLKHKIPEMITCPPAPAPKKNQAAQIFTSKEKSSVIVFKNPRRALQFDGSPEVEYLISSMFRDDLCRKITKSRRGGGAE